MIGMLGKYLLVKMNWLDNVLKNSNSRALIKVIGYFQTKHNNVLSYMGMHILLDSINKGSGIHPIYQMTVIINNAQSFPQQLLHTIVNKKVK